MEVPTTGLKNLAQTSVEELFGSEKRLPWELVVHIFRSLDIEDMGQACLNWNEVASSDVLWASIYQRRPREAVYRVARLPSTSTGSSWRSLCGVFSAVLPESPNDSSLLASLGVALLACGGTARAEKDLQRACDLSPEERSFISAATASILLQRDDKRPVSNDTRATILDLYSEALLRLHSVNRVVLGLVEEGLVKLQDNFRVKTDDELEEELAWLTGLRLFKPIDCTYDQAWTDLLVRWAHSSLESSIDYTDAAQSLADNRVAGYLEAQLLLAGALKANDFSMAAFSRIVTAFAARRHKLAHLLCLFKMRETFGQAVLPHPLDTLVQWRIIQLLEQAVSAPPLAWMPWMGDACVEICLTRLQPVPAWLREEAETKLASESAATLEALSSWPSGPERLEAW